MELNFDRYTGWFNANIAWGDVSLSMAYNPNYEPGLPYMDRQNTNNDGGRSYTGPSENGYYEHIPISFYNAWTTDYASMRECFGAHDDVIFNKEKFHNANITCWVMNRFDYLEIRMPHGSFHTHGARWNSDSYTFPRDVAHPYLMNSPNLRANSIGIARPQAVCFNRKFKKDEHYINFHVMDPGPISLAHFYDNCRQINFPINLYQFTPEWNGQFWFEDSGVQFTQNLSPLSWQFSSNDRYDHVYCPIYDLFYSYKLPMIIDDAYYDSNDMPIPWLRNIAYMFANNGLLNYKHRIEIPAFIDNAVGMFYKVNYRSVNNYQNFNFDFNYNTIKVSVPAEPSGYALKPLMIDLSSMFKESGWIGVTVAAADTFVYNNNMTSRNLILPKRTSKTFSMFEQTVWNFNIHLDSNIITNTANMFRMAIGFNGDVNWYDSMPTNTVITGPGKINDASFMFFQTNSFNRKIWFPANGVDNATHMFALASYAISNDVTKFSVNFAHDSDVINGHELPNYIYAYDYNFISNVITPLQNTFENLCEDSNFAVALPSNINNASNMFMSAHLDQRLGGVFINDNSCHNASNMFWGAWTITDSIFVGNNSADNDCDGMFVRSLNIQKPSSGFIYFGVNSMKHLSVFYPVTNRDYRYGPCNVDVKYMTFDSNSGHFPRAFFLGDRFSVDQMFFNHAFISTNSFK